MTVPRPVSGPFIGMPVEDWPDENTEWLVKPGRSRVLILTATPTFDQAKALNDAGWHWVDQYVLVWKESPAHKLSPIPEGLRAVVAELSILKEIGR